MAFAINATQSKTVSIAFISLKTSIFGIVLQENAISMSKENHSKCDSNVSSYFQLLSALLPLCVLVDICTLAYFFLSTQFKKVFYFVFYIFHWIIGLFCIVAGLHNLHNSSDCQQSYSLIMAVVTLSVLYQINALIVMIGDLLVVLKYVHFGCNIGWLAIWYSAQVNNCQQINHTIVTFIHVILSVTNFIKILLSKFIDKICFCPSNWRILTIFSLFLMLFSYLMILLVRPISPNCNSSKLFQKVYICYGLIQLVSPLLLLIFLQEYVRDMRQDDVCELQQVF